MSATVSMEPDDCWTYTPGPPIDETPCGTMNATLPLSNAGSEKLSPTAIISKLHRNGTAVILELQNIVNRNKRINTELWVVVLSYINIVSSYLGILQSM